MHSRRMQTCVTIIIPEATDETRKTKTDVEAGASDTPSASDTPNASETLEDVDLI